MKELSIKEKAKRYDKAIEIAKNIYGASECKDILCTLETIFPELKESEDKKIKEWLIRLINTAGYRELDTDKMPCSRTNVVAWLEKQGEQNPTDKIEPKFKNGQWIVWQDKCYKVNYNGCGYELVDQDGLSTSLEYGTIDENAHLWTIQDAKDGDVLCTYECYEPKIVFILKGVPKKHYTLSYHCYYNIMYPHFDDGNKPGCLAPEDSDVKPATKEQRYTLMKAKADAGYTFDFDKKELKKIEHKPAWSEEDEIALCDALYCCKQAASIAKDENDMGNVWYAERWLKSLKEKYTWKPSDEQIEILEMVLTNESMDDNIARILRELREQLKKLKG